MVDPINNLDPALDVRNKLNEAITEVNGLDARDTANRDRANHTGTQPASTITGLATVATSGDFGDLSNTPPIGIQIGDLVQLQDVGGSPGLPAVDGSQLTGLPSGGAQNFTGLTDTPGSYLGNGGLPLVVNGLEDGLEFGAFPSPIWGGIGGTLSNQGDLQSALDSKLEPPDIANFETTTELDARDTANRDRANHTGTQPASTITGLATVATSGDFNDLSNTPPIGVQIGDLVQLGDVGGSAALPAVDGSQLTGLPSGVNMFTDLTDTPGSYLGNSGLPLVVNGTEDGLEFGSFPQTNWGDIGGTLSNQTDLQSALDTKLEASDISNFETSTELDARDTANRDRANHTGTQPASTVTGLASVATSGDFNDLTNTPSIGDQIGDLVQLQDVGGSPGLPAVDGSQLTGLPADAVPSVFGRTGPVVAQSGDYTVGQLASIPDQTLVGNDSGASANPSALSFAQVREGFKALENVQVWDTAGSFDWPVPAGVFRGYARVIGGGGGGAAFNATLGGGGGGGGGKAERQITGLVPGEIITVTNGAGGAAGVSSGDGQAGGTSSFGSFVSATGGKGGSRFGHGGQAGVGVGGDFNTSLGPGVLGSLWANDPNRLVGGAGGGPSDRIIFSQNAPPGLGPGAGGGGGGIDNGSVRTPSPGRDGIVILWY